MAKYWLTMSVVCALAISAFAAVHSKSNKRMGPQAVPGQYVVVLKAPAREMQLDAFAQTLGGEIVDRLRDNMILIQRDPKESRVEAIASLTGHRFVAAVDPNWIYHITKSPNDTEYSKLWGMSNTGAPDSEGIKGVKGVDIGAEKAWETTTGSKNVVVAIIDTGIDFAIPDLKDNAWTNVKEANGVAGVDDDKNGYVDDIHGYNFSENKGDSTDDNGHGSHCAGTIGARGDDGAGVAGVNWNVSLMAVKFLDANGSGTLANGVKAIDYARKNGAKVLSNSWGGGPFTQALFDVISATEKADELFIAAAGNDASDNDADPGYPASYKIENIISVAAVDARGELADFSNYGATTVHLAAPGVNIYSTAPAPTNFQFMSGTSMATPHVAGAAALLLADNPNQSYLQLKKRLIAGARPLHSLKGKTVSGGMLDVSYALSGAQPPADPNDPSLWTNKVSKTVSSAHPYGDKYAGSWTVTVPGAQRFSVHFSKLETEANYDKVSFYTPTGELIGTISGTRTDSFGPIIDGDTVVIKMTSDDSVNGYGFDIDSISYVQ